MSRNPPPNADRITNSRIWKKLLTGGRFEHKVTVSFTPVGLKVRGSE